MGWQMSTIAQCVTKTYNKDPRKQPDSLFTYIDVSSVDNSLFRITNPSILVGRDAPSRARKVVRKGDVIFATVRPTLRRVAFITNDFDNQICSTGYCVLRPNSAVDGPFLYYWLLTDEILHEVDSVQRGANYPAIRDSDLKRIKLPTPPLPEQHRIAAVLSLVQRAIEEQERLVALTTELKKALMHKLFTEGTRGEPQKQTEIGAVPESWEMVELETTGEVVYGIQAAVANNLEPIGTRILTNKNITLDGDFNLEKINYFELKTKRHFATILQKGDLLFNWRSGSKQHVGKTAYFDLEGEWVHSSFILRIRPKSEINGRYLFDYFNHLRESEYFIKLQTYAINAKFNKSAVNVLPTVVPDREEQDQIAHALDTAQRRIDSAKSKKTSLQDLFRTLLHQLMTAEIRVNDLDLEELDIEE